MRTLVDIRADICKARTDIEALQDEAREIFEADGPEADEAGTLVECLEDIAALLADEENDAEGET